MRKRLEAEGYRIVSLKLGARGPAGVAAYRLLQPRFSASLFSQELLALLDAGLGLIEALDILSRKAREGEARRVTSQLFKDVREGLSFSRSLEQQARHFSSLYIAGVRSGERTGGLQEALRRYLAYHQQMSQIRERLVGASIYPALLLGVGFLVICFLMLYVVPRFSSIYEDVGSDLPFLSRLLMKWGGALNQNAEWVILGIAALATTAGYVVTRPGFRVAIERRLWTLPGIGEKLRLYQFSRFFRTLAMLLSAGMPIVSALQQARGLLQQPLLEAGLTLAIREITEGQPISIAFERNGLADAVGVRLLVVGEQSGDMPEIMARIAQLYDDDISRWVARASRLFEPILMVFIGLVIGGIVLLMYMPIFELAGSIQ
ncbi:MAG TPA: type II secretion system F family protein [Solimonas sp.]